MNNFTIYNIALPEFKSVREILKLDFLDIPNFTRSQ